MEHGFKPRELSGCNSPLGQYCQTRSLLQFPCSSFWRSKSLKDLLLLYLERHFWLSCLSLSLSWFAFNFLESYCLDQRGPSHGISKLAQRTAYLSSSQFFAVFKNCWLQADAYRAATTCRHLCSCCCCSGSWLWGLVWLKFCYGCFKTGWTFITDRPGPPWPSFRSLF